MTPRRSSASAIRVASERASKNRKLHFDGAIRLAHRRELILHPLAFGQSKLDGTVKVIVSSKAVRADTWAIALVLNGVRARLKKLQRLPSLTIP